MTGYTYRKSIYTATKKNRNIIDLHTLTHIAFPLVLFGGWRVAFRFLLLLLPFFGHAWNMFEYHAGNVYYFSLCDWGYKSKWDALYKRNGSLNNQVSFSQFFAYRI